MTETGAHNLDRRPASHGATRPALHGVLVTYRRPAGLESMLRALSDQERTLDTLVVVDNDPEESAREAVTRFGASARAAGCTVSYVASGANLGPAGGIALGMRQVLTHAADDDWLLPLDDDDPPRTPSMFAELEGFGTRLRDENPLVGGVGLCGARFDTGRARGVRIPDDELTDAVPSDWFGGNNLPFYSVRAVRTVGVFDERLFFGFDDLDYGLRLSAAGFDMYAHGDLWHAERAVHGRLGDVAGPERTLGEPTWRRYYSLRNLLYILRKRGDRRGELRLVARGLGKPAFNLLRQPRLAARHLVLNGRAILDAYRGRMGLTVSPVDKP